MKHRGGVQPFNVGFRHGEAQSEVDGDAGDEQAMLIGALMVAADRGEPLGQTMLGNAVGNPAAGPLRALDVDRGAADDRREHGSDTGRARGGGFLPAGNNGAGRSDRGGVGVGCCAQTGVASTWVAPNA